jgi:hypothetical protein
MFDAESMIEIGDSLGVVPRYRRVFIVNAGVGAKATGGEGVGSARAAPTPGIHENRDERTWFSDQRLSSILIFEHFIPICRVLVPYPFHQNVS